MVLGATVVDVVELLLLLLSAGVEVVAGVVVLLLVLPGVVLVVVLAVDLASSAALASVVLLLSGALVVLLVVLLLLASSLACSVVVEVVAGVVLLVELLSAAWGYPLLVQQQQLARIRPRNKISLRIVYVNLPMAVQSTLSPAPPNAFIYIFNTLRRHDPPSPPLVYRLPPSHCHAAAGVTGFRWAKLGKLCTVIFLMHTLREN